MAYKNFNLDRVSRTFSLTPFSGLFTIRPGSCCCAPFSRAKALDAYRPASYPGQLTLFLARQEPAVADRPDVQLQGIIELACRLFDLLDVSLRSEERLHEASYRPKTVQA